MIGMVARLAAEKGVEVLLNALPRVLNAYPNARVMFAGPYQNVLGEEAYAFVDFLQQTGQKLWQILPLAPTGYADSPYASFSAFAGNPFLISPDLLKNQGLLRPVLRDVFTGEIRLKAPRWRCWSKTLNRHGVFAFP